MRPRQLLKAYLSLVGLQMDNPSEQEPLPNTKMEYGRLRDTWPLVVSITVQSPQDQLQWWLVVCLNLEQRM